MDEKINVLHLGCGICRDIGFTNSLINFMEQDTRLAFDSTKGKDLKSSWDFDGDRNEMKSFTQRLNDSLLGKVISSPINANDFHQVFNFNIPYLGKNIDLRLEAFGLAFGEIRKDPRIVQPAFEALGRHYDVLGLCPFCADDQLGLSERVITRLAANYNASLEITPEKIIELARR
jgi:hypothetical protein